MFISLHNAVYYTIRHAYRVLKILADLAVSNTEWPPPPTDTGRVTHSGYSSVPVTSRWPSTSDAENVTTVWSWQWVTHTYIRHKTSTNNRIWQRTASLPSIRLLFHSRESFSVHERVSFNIVVLPPRWYNMYILRQNHEYLFNV